MGFYIIVFIIAVFVIYWVANFVNYIIAQIGFPKAGQIAAVFVVIASIVFCVYLVFQDHFFTKSNAAEYLSEQGILVSDDFEILENNSSFAIGDYYHYFTLKISDKDAQRISEHISKNADKGIIETHKGDQKILKEFSVHDSIIYEQNSQIFRMEGMTPIRVRITLDKSMKELSYKYAEE
ncbi:MAG: hypothetical protein CL663_07340 [Bacteroidetes bacterium]|nr:hypothetical protein [Bacteroidota bacterium]|tara:strand:- start:146 stop:685 length:540 start_codon:yes stop_codon:yes gene_type:complete